MTRWICVALAVAACHGRAREDAPARSGPTPPVPVTAAPDVESLYDLPLHLRDANDRAIGLDVGRGHTTLVSMFYGSCPTACPALIDNLTRVIGDTPDVRVVLVSFDPARDTPARLRELVRDHHLDGRWTLASASEPEARELAALLGYKYRDLGNGSFFHNIAVVAVDGEGRPVARMTWLGEDEALRAVVHPGS